MPTHMPSPAHMLSLDEMVDVAIAGALPRGRRGRPDTPPLYLRDLAPEDAAGLLDRPLAAMGTRAVTRIRTTHHMAARLLAEGRASVEVGAMTGYTPARINQLQKDPTFQELVAHYKDQVEAKYLNVHERLASLGIRVTEEIMERLEEDPDSFSNEELRKLAESTLDRGGYGPQSKRVIDVNSRSVSLTLVEAVKAEVAAKGRVRQLGEDLGLGEHEILALPAASGQPTTPVGGEAAAVAVDSPDPSAAAVAGNSPQGEPPEAEG
jgi:hypothetical protein